MAVNKFQKLNDAMLARTFTSGLNRIEQANCKCTLTDNGFRIYRPPNVTYNSSDTATRTMWGGLIIQPFADDSNFLIKGHSYIMLFHVSGKSSNDATHRFWSNNAGWSGGSYGLTTSPTNVVSNTIGANFQGEKDIYYKFTVSDDIMKTCTASYSSFTQGTKYNCYRDFKWGFDYMSTGALGTDLYITNFRCYDITNNDFNETQIYKTGVLESDLFVENNITPQVYKYSEVAVNEFIEW